ncbi:alkaline phosphatase [Cavenderia fasciculata]|uniref:Alkaline phosphatase n=1 Tax=Cavenderia fasciculata TaxID=261658 RepID=F4PU27_CACFS|nr:alkaline phosphatase [Cavenderia fasciculata]EGG20953.1 alkaline phosphatase [Cavenderia fasciculata]|eukprot:XP_004358803.1 alkaline phosphatase [Cavenderia fasciculata]
MNPIDDSNNNNNNIKKEEPQLKNDIELYRINTHDDINESFYNSQKKEGRFSGRSKRVFYLLAAIAVIVTVVLLIVFLIPRDKDILQPKRNIILLIGDGFGPASATMARIAKNGKTGVLNMDSHLVGTLKTFSSSSDVTDSAAGATAYAAGVHTYNGAISVDPDTQKPVGAIIDATTTQGLRSGLVVTTRLSDATPACFYAHSSQRQYEEFIISQVMNSDISVLMGGGLSKWSNATLDTAKSRNYTIASTRDEMWASKNTSKILGLFAADNLPYEIDRVTFGMTHIPTLAEMTTKALQILSEDNDSGFFLMVEGSQIDIAGHSNDAATQIRETLALDAAFQVVLEYAKNDPNTIVLMTADHETGGLTLGYQPVDSYAGEALYQWDPYTLMSINASSQTMAGFIQGNITAAGPTADIATIIRTTVGHYTPSGNVTITDADIAFLAPLANTTSMWVFGRALGRVISSKANVGFTTTGHTGVDVNLYAFHANDQDLIEELRGNHENIYLGQFIASNLKLDLAAQTTRLANFSTTPSPQQQK